MRTPPPAFTQHPSVCPHERLRGAVCLDCGDWQIVSCPRCGVLQLNLEGQLGPPRRCSACGALYRWTQEQEA